MKNVSQSKNLIIITAFFMITGIQNLLATKDSLFSIMGSADLYFRTNLNSTNNPENGGTLAPATSFANLPGFSLGMANIVGTYEGKKVGFVADLVFGPRGTEAVFGSSPSQNILNQLYGYWNITDEITATLGNFNTFLGYEVISPAGNFNYSTSYMFSYGPFSHSGLKLDFDLGNGFSLMTGVFNPTDATDFNPTSTYLGGAQFGYENEKIGAWLNFVFDDHFFQIDLTTGWQASKDFYVGLNATSASDNFLGVAGYLQYATSEALSLGIRAEYFEDRGIGVLKLAEGGGSENVLDFTLSANYTVGNMTIIPEVRIDAFSYEDAVITDALNSEAAKSLSSFVLAVVYAF